MFALPDDSPGPSDNYDDDGNEDDGDCNYDDDGIHSKSEKVCEFCPSA